MKTCIACGMPMEAPGDFALGDVRKDWCRFCARADGTMQSWEEKVVSMGRFLARTQGLERAAAEKLAAGKLAEMPAFRKRKV